MLINEITVKNGKQVKAKSKMPKLIKPTKDNESPHPFRGKLVGEDWGSSDGTNLVQGIDKAIEKYGLSPEVIQSAAQELAEFYYDDMGYDSPEEAVDAVIDTWKRRSETGRALAQMFAPVDEAYGSKPVAPKRNPVAKNLNKFNKPATHQDKKYQSKQIRGHKFKQQPDAE